MSLNLVFAPVEITSAELLQVAAEYAGQPFALDGHYAFRSECNLIEARLDCLRYLFYVWRDCGLWPVEWGKALPRELRALRLQAGNLLRSIDDFPMLSELLAKNFVTVPTGERQPGDVLCFKFAGRVAAHHAALAAPGCGLGAMWHVPARGLVSYSDLDESWIARLNGVYRLNNLKEAT